MLQQVLCIVELAPSEPLRNISYCLAHVHHLKMEEEEEEEEKGVEEGMVYKRDKQLCQEAATVFPSLCPSALTHLIVW